jgi:hypothetical protein
LSNSFLQKPSSIMAQAGEVLFKLPIAATNGEIVVTQPKPQVYLLTFNSPDDNRLLAVSYLITLIHVRRPDIDCLKQEFCDTFRLALDILEARYEPGVLITTSGIAKYDIPWSLPRQSRETANIFSPNSDSTAMALTSTAQSTRPTSSTARSTPSGAAS